MKYDVFISYCHATDKPIASGLQTALESVVKRNGRTRLRTFRDETGLAVDPSLWDSITKALKSSRYFVLLVSPEAAQSDGVNREIEAWLRCRSVDQMLLVLTGGTLEWDVAQGDFDPDSSTALPRALEGVFDDEPRYLDLRGLAETGSVPSDLTDHEYRLLIAGLAAPIARTSPDRVRFKKRWARVAVPVGLAMFVATLGGLLFVRAPAVSEAAQTIDLAEIQTGRANISRTWLLATPRGGVLQGTVRVKNLSSSPLNAGDHFDEIIPHSLARHSKSIKPLGDAIGIDTTHFPTAENFRVIRMQLVGIQPNETKVFRYRISEQPEGASLQRLRRWATAAATARQSYDLYQTDHEVSKLRIDRAPTVLKVGDSWPLNPVATSATGRAVAFDPVTPPIWSTSDASIATIDASGIVTAVAAGSATLSAQIAGISAQVTIVVQVRVNIPPLVGKPQAPELHVVKTVDSCVANFGPGFNYPEWIRGYRVGWVHESAPFIPSEPTGTDIGGSAHAAEQRFLDVQYTSLSEPYGPGEIVTFYVYAVGTNGQVSQPTEASCR